MGETIQRVRQKASRLVAVCLAGSLLAPALAADKAASVAVVPTPQVERRADGNVVLGGQGAAVGLACRHVDAEGSTPLKLGLELLAARLRALGGRLEAGQAQGLETKLVVEKCPAAALSKQLAELGLGEPLDARRLGQAYLIQCQAAGEQRGMVVRACADLGLYYGLVSACQLLDRDDQGRLYAPATTIADWPAIGLRLAKTSASENPVRTVDGFAAWLPLYKINLIGIQYHGRNSKTPEKPFPQNVQHIGSEARRSGLLESVVYFCPFRGGANAYDFRRDEDRRQYVDYMTWLLAQGAHGIEIDYNDWPDKASGVAIEDVINLACQGIAARHPDAYVLYCPPLSMYRGMARPELAATLSRVPRKVWPLWTGMATLIKVLKQEDVEEWTRRAGRRPFLWVNRVVAGKQFSRKLGDAYVFRGEALPRDLDRLFEGVHFNAGLSQGYNRLPREFTPQALAYLATAADFVWNPREWDAAESCRRARRFVAIMAPLLGARALLGKPPKPIAAGHPTWRPLAGEWGELEGAIRCAGSGKVAILESKAQLPRGAKGLSLQASVQTLEVSGSMNGYLAFGRDVDSQELYFAGAAFGSQHWVVARAQPGATAHTALHRVKADIPIDKPHVLRVHADYAAGEVVLSECIDGQWHERLRHRHPSLKGLSPAAGVAVKWGTTEFRSYRTLQ